MARSKPTSKPAALPIMLVAALVIVGAYLALTWYQRQEGAGAPLEQTAELASDERLVFGGAPQPMPGAGDEVRCTVLKNQGYIVGYSDWRRDPLWVCYRVFHVEQPFDFPRPSSFASDPRTAARVKDGDFAKSGYQRGHMAPNAAIMRELGRDAQMETFLLSNICPQSPELNERVWERLEAVEKKYADQFEEVWVIDGPIFGDLNGGATARLASGIAVPTAFFKILIDEEGRRGGKPRVFSVIMPQNVAGTELPQQFLTTISEIQKETHLDFLWKLDAATQAELEATKWKMW
jgi:endonuclease G, mitochondrial